MQWISCHSGLVVTRLQYIAQSGKISTLPTDDNVDGQEGVPIEMNITESTLHCYRYSLH